MSKLKQKYNAFRTAESNFNRRKVNLHKEFSQELNKAAIALDKERYTVLAEEMVRTLGKEYDFTATSIKILHNLNW